MLTSVSPKRTESKAESLMSGSLKSSICLKISIGLIRCRLLNSVSIETMASRQSCPMPFSIRDLHWSWSLKSSLKLSLSKSLRQQPQKTMTVRRQKFPMWSKMATHISTVIRSTDSCPLSSCLKSDTSLLTPETTFGTVMVTVRSARCSLEPTNTISSFSASLFTKDGTLCTTSKKQPSL